MSEQEIKEQIERDARNEATNDEDDFSKSAFSELRAFGVHQDKIATNRTVEAAIAIINSLRPLTGPEIIKELEKLRR